MKKYVKYLLFFIILALGLFVGCSEEPKEDDKPVEEPCKHEECEWVWEEEAKCNKNNTMYYTCLKCGEVLDEKEEFKDHELVETREEPTCTENGLIHAECKNCTYKYNKVLSATGHDYEVKIEKEATDTEYGIKYEECATCHTVGKRYEYVNNGFSSHGKLRVVGTKLLDENNNVMVLAGLSTHGLQWAGKFVNLNTFKALRNEWGINVMRLSLYPEEGGYSECSETKKEELYQLVASGIRYCTELDMYVIVDWHMLGENFHTEDAVEFFDRISKEFKDQNNILYEIMNEPSRGATWANCKAHANACIPVIRNNQPNAVILVGNPSFSADLVSVANSPLDYDNIMYTFHFYAADNCMTDKITTAIKKRIPVFISEHGGMDADGNGSVDFNSLNKWYKVIDDNKLSFVAWNLSNTKGDASIFKPTTTTLDDLSDDLLKPWGITYRDRVRKYFGLPVKTTN